MRNYLLPKTLALVYPVSGDMHLGDLAEDGSQLRPHIVWFEEPVPLIEEAAALVADADIVAVIGTSLVVYPAAGLITFADYMIPKFIIDKKIPAVEGIYKLTKIEKPAGEGIRDLQEKLLALK